MDWGSISQGLQRAARAAWRWVASILTGPLVAVTALLCVAFTVTYTFAIASGHPKSADVLAMAAFDAVGKWAGK